MKKPKQYPPKKRKSFYERYTSLCFFLCFLTFIVIAVAVDVIWDEEAMNIFIAVIIAGSIGFGCGWALGKDKGIAEERDRHRPPDSY